jgi:transposase
LDVIANMCALGLADAPSGGSADPGGAVQSRQRQHARLSRDRRRVRNVLYVATLSAARSNPAIREFCRRLRAKGKPAKITLAACMRRIAIILNARVRDPLGCRHHCHPVSQFLCSVEHRSYVPTWRPTGAAGSTGQDWLQVTAAGDAQRY